MMRIAVNSRDRRESFLPLIPQRSLIGNSRNNMPAFGASYSADQLQDVATYIAETLAGPKH